jgi:hypothetical protein
VIGITELRYQYSLRSADETTFRILGSRPLAEVIVADVGPELPGDEHV